MDTGICTTGFLCTIKLNEKDTDGRFMEPCCEGGINLVSASLFLPDRLIHWPADGTVGGRIREINVFCNKSERKKGFINMFDFH